MKSLQNMFQSLRRQFYLKKDGHIHTPYCPHGTLDPFQNYIEKAIQNDFQEISFTEHAPLPD